MKNQPHILLASNSSARRSRLSSLVLKKFKHEELKVVSGFSAYRLSLEATAADILIADLEGPSAVAKMIEVLRESPGRLGAVALIDDPDPQWVHGALDAGVNAIISHNPDADELHLAIAAAEAGLILLHPSSARNLAVRNLQPSPSTSVETLTARECQVLRLISEGLGNKEIAARLGISEHTAKFHISSILGKLGVASRTEAVSDGIRKGLIPI